MTQQCGDLYRQLGSYLDSNLASSKAILGGRFTVVMAMVVASGGLVVVLAVRQILAVSGALQNKVAIKHGP